VTQEQYEGGNQGEKSENSKLGRTILKGYWKVSVRKPTKECAVWRKAGWETQCGIERGWIETLDFLRATRGLPVSRGFKHSPTDGGSTDLWHFGKLIPVYTAL
jgi:hypothetical protein